MTKFRNREGIQAVNSENRTFEALQGNYVDNGVEVTTDGADMTLDYTSGTVVQDNTEHEIPAGTVTIPDNTSDHPRKDIVYIDSTQSVEVATGAAANPEPSLDSVDNVFDTAQPSPPSLVNEDGVVVLAEVWVGADASSISSGELSDRRPFLKLETGGSQTEEFDNVNSGSSATIDWNNGRNQKMTLTDDVIIEFIDPDFVGRRDVRLINDATGGYDITWPSNVVWPQGEPVWTDGEPDEKIVVTVRFDGENYIATATAWYER